MIEFPSPPIPPNPGGCTLEPAAYALDWLVTKWHATVRVNGEAHERVLVADLLRRISAEPAAFGVNADEARRAVERFVTLGGQVLEREGGSAAWLAREFPA
ncbi:hypothetical protein [Deinococcus yavapaiensis]|uniref:Uncharacterized protein n=1 Tax=Deinococcus yavapaiensis KR-236 TaxID=694435 RepID=A0A318S7U8_9DEIO|nr:hypothetical protein [Deinococcus yavapaiensis]PYE54937.1 hypothetical protein DES52_104211 [Deinococcus yavapaiensis KR-236]